MLFIRTDYVTHSIILFAYHDIKWPCLFSLCVDKHVIIYHDLACIDIIICTYHAYNIIDNQSSSAGNRTIHMYGTLSYLTYKCTNKTMEIHYVNKQSTVLFSHL